MSKPRAWILLCLTAAISTGCKKSATPGSNPPTSSHTPNFAAEYFQSAQVQNGKFAIFDLNHDDNADKQFFLISLIKDGNGFLDSAAVAQPPASINTIASSWPAQIKSAAFGHSMDIVTDAKNFVRSNAGSAWQFNPIPTTTNLYRKLNDPVYAGTMAGKKPYGNNAMRTQYKPGPSYHDYLGLYRDITYYFKDGFYTTNTQGAAALPFDSLFDGAAQIDWKNIDQVVKADVEDAGTHTRYFTRYLFFDWANWRYWVVAETEKVALYPSYAPVYYIGFNVRGPLSLDKFCQWPQGWGKK